MRFDELAARARESRLLVGFSTSGIWLVASLVPISLLARLCVVALYSLPETDDFCLSYLNAAYGFIKTTWIWYNSVVGRVLPLLLIQMPAAISGATGVDYFMSYSLTMTTLTVAFVAALVFAASRLWPHANFTQAFFIGTTFAATMLAGLPSLREALYWLPGVTCYTVPGAITLLLLSEFVQTAVTGSRITKAATCTMAIGGFLAALCNEFTPIWLMGIFVCSLVVRASFWRGSLEIRPHAIVGGATLIGFVILLLAPGNFVRIGMFPLAGQFVHSIIESYWFFSSDLTNIFSFRWLRAWLIIVMIFTAVLPQPARVSSGKQLLLAALLPVYCIACGYFAYFVAEYATGSNLAQRAQNEVFILLISGSTISAVLVARAFRSSMPQPGGLFPAHWNFFAMPIIGVVMGVMMLSPLKHSITMLQVRAEQSAIHTLWLERMQRHALLSLSTEQDIFVPRFDVFPTTQIGEDLTDDPNRLPNDCIAAFYKKKAVRPEPQKTTTADPAAQTDRPQPHP